MEYLEPILLKDGRLCILRSGTDADGEAALENFIRTHEQTDYLLSYPDEIRFTAAEEGEFLRKPKARTRSRSLPKLTEKSSGSPGSGASAVTKRSRGARNSASASTGNTGASAWDGR